METKGRSGKSHQRPTKMMPRLVRRKPLWERITSMLDPMDFLLWLSEEIETREWDSTLVGTQLGVGMNLVFLIARANYAASEASDGDIFGDYVDHGWLPWFVSPIVWVLVVASFINAIYALSRTRKYRLFQSNSDLSRVTPSAKRVKIQSMPASSTPLQHFADMITSESAESSAHPDKTQDVWELSVWDPLPMTLRLLCLFSPGHVLVYMMFLPLATLDPQPSVTVFNTIVMQILLSVQMLVFSSRFARQAKDNSIIQKEVMHEYETKFVHPRIHPVVRDVGTQVGSLDPDNQRSARIRDFVQLGSPTTLVRHAFLSRPKPMVPTDVALFSPSTIPKPQAQVQAQVQTQTQPQTQIQPQPQPQIQSSTQLFTPLAPRHQETMTSGANPAASIAKLGASRGNIPSSASVNFVSASSNSGSTSLGGHMGIYNHAKSPLKKAISLHDVNSLESLSPRNSREMAAYEQSRAIRQTSPIKRIELRPPSELDPDVTHRSPSPFARGGTRERSIPRW